MKDRNRLPFEEQRRVNNLRKSVWKNRRQFIQHIFNDKNWAAFLGQAKDIHVPSDDMLAHIQAEIQAQDARRESQRGRVLRFMRYSAAACALLCMSFFGWRYLDVRTDRSPSTQLVDVTLPEGLRESLWVNIDHQEGTRKKVLLPDGSRMVLFPNSQIRFLKNFTASSREIVLQGKGYFEVAKDSARPFSVYVNGTKTTALGTSFTIDASSTTQNTAITLHSGKIVVASTKSRFKKTFLRKAGERILVNKAQRLASHYIPEPKVVAPEIKAEVPHVDSEVSIHTFEDVAMDRVIQTLREVYNVEIHVDQTLLQSIRYTEVIDSNKDSIEDVLNVLCLINDLRWYCDAEGVYTIKKQENIHH